MTNPLSPDAIKEAAEKKYPFVDLPGKDIASINLEQAVKISIWTDGANHVLKQLEWIPVETATFGTYLVYDPNEFKEYRIKTATKYETGNWIDSAGDTIHPSHWLPLSVLPMPKTK